LILRCLNSKRGAAMKIVHLFLIMIFAMGTNLYADDAQQESSVVQISEEVQKQNISTAIDNSVQWVDDAVGTLAKPLDFISQPISLGDENITFQLGGQYRYRLELRDDFNFNDATFEDDDIHLMRTRLNGKIKIGEHISIYAQGQDAESFAGREAHKSRAFVNRLDLRQLYGEFESPWEDFPVRVKVGRQELSYGDQRFVGAFNWSNVARVFDAVKVMVSPVSWFDVDLFFSQVVRINRSQPDSAAHDDNFYGIYTTLKPVKDHLLDTFLFIRHNKNGEIRGEIPGRLGQLKEYTFGNRFKGKKWNFDYGAEWALQFGSRARDEINAWALHVEAGYTFKDCPWSPRISFEYNHGSGDSDPTDGKNENFDNLFPTNHLHYGYMDFASLRNIENIKVAIDFKPHKKIKFTTAYHWFFLDTSGSSWFNAGGGVIRPRTPGASETIGQELDLTLKWNMNKHLNLFLGYSHFNAGAFIKDTGASDNANFFYMQSTVKF